MDQTWPTRIEYWVSMPAEFSRVKRQPTLPVQQVTKIDLTVNMRTAKALGITFPTPAFASADRVIE